MQKIILVTGASSGFGRLTSLALARGGDTVYASMRDTSGRNAGNAEELRRISRAEGIDLREAERLFGKERAARVLRDAEPWLKSRTLVLAAGRMAVPPARMLVSDAVIETFFETEPDTATK